MRSFIIALLLALIITFSGCGRRNIAESPLVSDFVSPTTKNHEPPESNSTPDSLNFASEPTPEISSVKNKSLYYYDATKVKIGDSINGMKVKDVNLSINPEYPGYEGIIFDIIFEGEFEVTGTIELDEFAETYAIFNNDYVSDVLPYSSFEEDIDSKKSDKMNVYFYILNEESLIEEMAKAKRDYKKGDEAKIRAMFSSYSFNIYGFQYSHWAKFEKLIEVY